ncbi:hypothetical protein L7F22_013016 [Adiantum nelumboides]|nr:hypothetical protein [Adiantum nelumboides]
METKGSMGLPPSVPGGMAASFNGMHAKGGGEMPAHEPHTHAHTQQHTPSLFRVDASRVTNTPMMVNLPIAVTPLAASPLSYMPDMATPIISHTTTLANLGPHPHIGFTSSDSVKKKRGRPRKYGPDGTVSIVIKPFSSPSPGPMSPLKKRGRGRPPGSGKNQQLAALGESICGTAGAGFTPHAITVTTGEQQRPSGDGLHFSAKAVPSDLRFSLPSDLRFSARVAPSDLRFSAKAVPSDLRFSHLSDLRFSAKAVPSDLRFPARAAPSDQGCIYSTYLTFDKDVAARIMSFSQQGPRGICILSANGAISNVTLRQPSTSGGTVTYEGRFEILSLSGSFLVTDSNGTQSRTGGLSVSLAGPDGRVVGGGVAGMLLAASPVQVVVGSFICGNNLKKAQSKQPKVDSANKLSVPSTQKAGCGSAAPEMSMNETADLKAESPALNHSSANGASSAPESPQG